MFRLAETNAVGAPTAISGASPGPASDTIRSLLPSNDVNMSHGDCNVSGCQPFVVITQSASRRAPGTTSASTAPNPSEDTANNYRLGPRQFDVPLLVRTARQHRMSKTESRVHTARTPRLDDRAMSHWVANNTAG